MRRPAAPAAALLAGSLVLSGCSLLPGDDEPAPAPTTSSADARPTSTAWQRAPRAEVARGGTLRLAATAVPRNFNPDHPDAVASEAAEILAPTVGNAVRVMDDGGWKVDPDYAESVEVVDEDPLKVRVKLNRDAVWEGGSPITADDMIAYWKAMNGSDPDYEVASTEGYEDIEAVEPGESRFDYTVRFERPNAEWPRYVYPRLPAKVSGSAEAFNDGFRARAVSSNGPFVVKTLSPDAGRITLVRNPRWWGAAPRLKAITWRFAAPQVQVEAFAAGDLDAVDLEPGTYATGADADGGVVQRASGIEWSQVTLNAGRGPLRDADVRRAVAHAIDRGPIARKAAAPMEAPPSPLGSVIRLPGQQGYVDSSRSIALDRERARRLLDRAGWREGAGGIRERKGKRLVLSVPVPSDTPTNRDRSRLIAADLAKVGIEVELRTVPADTFFDRSVIPLDFDLVTFVRRGSAFPIGAAEAMFHPVDSAQNYTGIGPERIGRGFEIVSSTLDDDLRDKRVPKLDEWVFASPTVVPLAVTPIVTAVRDTVVNFGAAQFEQPDWTIVGFTAKD